MFRILRLVALALLLCLSGKPLRADVIYNFTQQGLAAGGTGAADLRFDASITVTDAAAARGFDFFIRNGQQGSIVSHIDGLVNLGVRLEGRFMQYTISLADYLTSYPSAWGYSGSLALQAGPGGMPVGNFEYTAQVVDFRVTSDGGSLFSGSAGADGGIPCFFQRCTFAGVVTTAVPEPASLALYLSGIMALGVALAWRRPAAPRTRSSATT